MQADVCRRAAAFPLPFSQVRSLRGQERALLCAHPIEAINLGLIVMHLSRKPAARSAINYNILDFVLKMIWWRKGFT